MNPTTEAAQPASRFALAVATGLGLGYLPTAPGTWGSLLGVVLAIASFSTHASLPLLLSLIVAASLGGVWAAGRAAAHLGRKDPQIVVIDEVSGQLISYLLLAIFGASSALDWKYLLAGFILFRVFDIWKPFPARQAESLPGGLGIMADDWVAGVYAALVLALARQLGL
jgi:phosphatidylglycerophosphatase A